MAVLRIPKDSLKKIMDGKTNITEPTACVVKFYSNNCHLCHALSSYYIDISNQEQYENIHFYAYNIDGDPQIAEKLGLNGVPSIALYNVAPNRKPKLILLDDPERPNQETWYTVKDITNFIEDNLQLDHSRAARRKRRRQQRKERIKG